MSVDKEAQLQRIGVSMDMAFCLGKKTVSAKVEDNVYNCYGPLLHHTSKDTLLQFTVFPGVQVLAGRAAVTRPNCENVRSESGFVLSSKCKHDPLTTLQNCSLTQDGSRCGNVVNRSECEYCLYHAKAALRQFTNRRPDVQGVSLFERQLKPVVDKGGVTKQAHKDVLQCNDNSL